MVPGPIYEHMVINEGKLHTRGETFLLELARDLLCDDRTLCPGMLEDFNELGYKPENIGMMCKMGLTGLTTPTVRGICTVAVFLSVSRPFLSLHCSL